MLLLVLMKFGTKKDYLCVHVRVHIARGMSVCDTAFFNAMSFFSIIGVGNTL
jgi:hypothetical protein